ncbi:hypothetical protein FIA58_020340 [Flavobacterium jejuense]|uniref:Uncharacterized protein n=1 Tax=Flavobacterium jejuense TaxID=1544455 RepID=A0ABX0IVU2_9FLAO|nr:DUF6498-containing protein [Flavobacterium jejuense]NHN28034.1 hypothetical protein [Flavobacterium jejuense]
MKYDFFKNKLQNNPSIIANALFLIALVLIGKVDPMAIVFAYVFETIIIGLVHVVKLFYIIRNNKPGKRESKVGNFLLIPFFIIHYGIFVAIQSIFLYTAFAINDDRFSTSLSFSNFVEIFHLEGFKLVALSILATHVASLYFSFLKTKKYENQNLGAYMIKPYLRIFMQQFLAIIPFLFLFFTNAVGLTAAILLIIMRTILDYYLTTIAKDSKKIKALAIRIMDQNKPEELPKIEATLKVFFEE